MPLGGKRTGDVVEVDRRVGVAVAGGPRQRSRPSRPSAVSVAAPSPLVSPPIVSSRHDVKVTGLAPPVPLASRAPWTAMFRPC